MGGARDAVRVPAPGASGADDPVQLVDRVGQPAQVDHEDVAPGGTAPRAEQPLNPVAAQSHQHAVGGGDQASSVAVHEPDVAAIAPVVGVLAGDDAHRLRGAVGGGRKVRGRLANPVIGAGIEDVGHQHRLPGVLAGGARAQQEIRFAERVPELGQGLEHREARRGDAVAPDDLVDHPRGHASAIGVLPPPRAIALCVHVFGCSPPSLGQAAGVRARVDARDQAHDPSAPISARNVARAPRRCSESRAHR